MSATAYAQSGDSFSPQLRRPRTLTSRPCPSKCNQPAGVTSRNWVRLSSPTLLDNGIERTGHDPGQPDEPSCTNVSVSGFVAGPFSYVAGSPATE